MRGHRYFAAIAAILGTSFGLAAQETFHIEMSPDGAFAVELREVPRRVALERLLPADVKVQWSENGLADEVVSGNFRGTQADIVKSVLARLNFIIAHDDSQTRIMRVVVLGRASGPLAGSVASAPEVRRPDVLRQAAAVEEKRKKILLSQVDSATLPNGTGRQQMVPEYKPSSALAPFPATGAAADKAASMPVHVPPGNADAPLLPFSAPDAGGKAPPGVPALPKKN
jgi:hypothetical protein